MTLVMVFCMEKTGSTTVMRAIQSAGLVAGRGHRHNIKDLDLSEYTHFVTMVREPISRAISGYFEEDMQGGLEDLKQEVDFTLNWFDDYIRPAIGVNAYSPKSSRRLLFNRKIGWSIYSKKLLIVRTDRLNDGLADGLAELLGMNAEDFTVEHRAMGNERFGDRYDRFIEQAKFDNTYLFNVYRHKYCKSFFYVKETKELIERWRKKRE